jgi:hypothetical protein
MTEATEVALIAATPPFVAALGALFLGWRNGKKLTTIHVDMNSRFTEFLRLKGEASYAAGVSDEKERQK